MSVSLFSTRNKDLYAKILGTQPPPGWPGEGSLNLDGGEGVAGALMSDEEKPRLLTRNAKGPKFMTAKGYCELVERLDRFQKQLVPTIIIKDDHSPLISLKESDFNLMFEPSFYKDYKYMVRKSIFAKIGRISKILDKEDKQLIIRSVWRAFAHQKLLRERKVKIIQKEHPNKSLEEINTIVSYFIAPEEESMHSTGGAVDALIYDLEKDCVMDFGNNDGLHLELNKTCYPFHPDISSQVRQNRELLINLFENEGFVVDPKEYWHFDYGNAIWAVEKGKNHAEYGTIKKIAGT